MQNENKVTAAGEVIGALAEQIIKQRKAEIYKWQKDTFPQDPVLLYQLYVIDKSNTENNSRYYYVVPKDELTNPDTSPTIVFFDVIEQDTIVERAFVGCSVVITKVVFSTVDELLKAPNAPVVFDKDHNAPRASKVMLGLLGIIK